MKTNRAIILIFALILVFIASSIAGAGEDEGIKVKVRRCSHSLYCLQLILWLFV